MTIKNADDVFYCQEMLSKISAEDMENPKIAPHFQHYDNKKRR
jgi:hypothetical protein